MADRGHASVHVHIEIAREGEKLRVTLRRRGLAGQTYLAPITYAQLSDFARGVREAANDGRSLDTVVPSASEVYDAVFGDRLPGLVAGSIDSPAVVHLHLGDPELDLIPWEALHDPELGFLGISTDLAIVRNVEVNATTTSASFDTEASLVARLASGTIDVLLCALFPGRHIDVFAEELIKAISSRGWLEGMSEGRETAFKKLHRSPVVFALVLYVRAGVPVKVRPSDTREALGLTSYLTDFGFSSPPRPKPVARGELFPNVSASADAVEPEQIVTFVLQLDATGPRDLAPLAVEFPANAETVMVLATISSSSFDRPEGQAWEQRFTVDRRLRTTPTTWEFRARALGDRRFYELTISFDVGDSPAGAYALRLRRKGAPALPEGRPNGGLLRIPRIAGAARLVLKIAAEGPLYRLRLLRDGSDVLGEPALWTMNTDSFFTKLDVAKSEADIRQLGWGLHTSLPRAVTTILEDPAMGGLPLLIESGAPVAPFELLRLRPRQNGPYLGIDRPVLRWADDLPMPDIEAVRVTRAACIRPDYPPPDRLPSAEQEEADLNARFPGLSIKHVAMRAELEVLLQDASVHLIHFAGHADGNPAGLSLQDGKVEPAYFDPGTPLMNAGPFLFLNGCRAGAGRTQVPEFQANMLKMMLAANCAGAVAPLTKVVSEAALGAANAFYGAVSGGSPIGEAVRQVRELAFAENADPKNVASYLSYLAFAPPHLRISFGAAR